MDSHGRGVRAHPAPLRAGVLALAEHVEVVEGGESFEALSKGLQPAERPVAGRRHPAGASQHVVNVLDMWSFIEEAYEKLSYDQKAQIEREAEPLGKHVMFAGFDGNNESRQIGIARFLIEKNGVV